MSSARPSSTLGRILRSASFRLTLFYAALFIASAGALFATVYVTATAAMQTDMAAVLRSEAYQLAEVHSRTGLTGLAQQITRRINFRTRGPIFYLLQAPNGRVVVGNLPGMPPVNGVVDFVPKADTPAPEADGENTKLTGFGLTLSDGSFLLVAQDAARLTDMQHAIVRAFAWAGGLTLLLAIAGGAVLANSFLRRIDAITRTNRAIMEGDLSARIPVRGTQDEIDQLITSLNAMLDRIQQLMDGLRRVSSDIAHDLRTPLTRARLSLERGRTNATTLEQLQVVVDKAIAGIDQSLSIVTALLRLAEIENSRRSSAFGDVALDEMLREVCDMYEPIAEDKQIALSVASSGKHVVRGDRDLLVEAVANVLDNAIKFTPPGGSVKLELIRGADETSLRVTDSGPGISNQEQEAVLRRFYRSDKIRNTPGVGLGLNLVSAIAKLHGFRLVIHPGPGGRVEIVCPDEPAGLSG